MVPPNWSYFSSVIQPMLLTIQTAIVATVIGIVGAVPLSVLAARNTTPHPVLYNVVRLFVNTIRSIPALVLALIFITFVGLGPVPGALGLGLHTISSLTKLYAEAIEAVKPQPLEALSAAGANGAKRFRWGVFPQVFPLLVSSSIYYWESNTRDATVVAFVGGGGIGFLLNQNLSLLNYANVTVILVTLVITVVVLDRISDFVRARVL
jgi:phosphonate transport system permease protein